MKKTEHCPKCHVPLKESGNACAECGWSRRVQRAESREAPPDPNRYRCAWEADGKRCKYPGNLSSSTNGTGPYYCRWHFHCDDPVHGARLVQESQSYHPENPEAAFDAEVKASLKSRGLEQQPGESMHEFALRCQAWVKDNMKQIVKPLPYDPSKRYSEEMEEARDVDA